MTRKLDDEQERELVRRYARGEYCEALAKEFGISEAWVSLTAKKYGSAPGRSGRWHRIGKLTLSQRKEIFERFGCGERQSDLAKEFCISRSAVYEICKRRAKAAEVLPLNADSSFIQRWVNEKRPVPPPNVVKGISIERLMAGR